MKFREYRMLGGWFFLVADLLLQTLPCAGQPPVCQMSHGDSEMRQQVSTMQDSDTKLTQMGHTMLAVDTVSSLSHARSRPSSTQTHNQPEMKAVVCDSAGKQNVDWIRQAMEVVVVGHDSPRHIGESRPWLQWIVDNYHSLQSRIFFSHGHQVSWHCNHSIDELTMLRAPVTFLADCTWLGDGFWRGYEMPGLDSIHVALFNRSWQWWFNHHDFWHRKCCAESVVTSASIRKTDRRVYQELLANIDAKWDEPWGWIFERTWQSLFEEGQTGSTEDVVNALQELTKRPALGVSPFGSLQEKSSPFGVPQEWTMPSRAAFKCVGDAEAVPE